ncbi:glycosyltransferase, partial [Sedimentibacter sp. B4]|uniref:glycosyltransferase n=1 Tax=Sedimentibacter sp. B4 TaxID=304766 RepID=UPI0026F3BC66
SGVEALVAGRDRDFVVLGFTDRMADLMRVASLFVGKPGGLSSSECMAAGLPMVIVNPIPGQEVRNADYLL